MITDELFFLIFVKAHERNSLLTSRHIDYLIYGILGLYQTVKVPEYFLKHAFALLKQKMLTAFVQMQSIFLAQPQLFYQWLVGVDKDGSWLR